MHHHDTNHCPHCVPHEQGHESSKTVTDPVCGMSVSTETDLRYVHKGETFYFCSEHCRARFKQNPESFLHREEKPQQTEAETGVWYTCPMHPEVRQLGPGTCPKCGMALEPEAPSLEDEENPELTDFRRRFWISSLAHCICFLLLAV